MVSWFIMAAGKMAAAPCIGEQIQLLSEQRELQPPNPAASACNNPAAAAAAALLPSQWHA
jgi:hypothetical protein